MNGVRLKIMGRSLCFNAVLLHRSFIRAQHTLSLSEKKVTLQHNKYHQSEKKPF